MDSSFYKCHHSVISFQPVQSPHLCCHNACVNLKICTFPGTSLYEKQHLWNTGMGTWTYRNISIADYEQCRSGTPFCWLLAHCSAGMALPFPAKPEWFHSGDLWSCSSWLQWCFWAAGDELQEVSARMEPCPHRAALMLAQVRMCPVRFPLITSECCLEGAAPSSSCSPKKCCQNQDVGVCSSLTSSFSLEAGWCFNTMKGKGLDCWVNKEQPTGNLK